MVYLPIDHQKVVISSVRNGSASASAPPPSIYVIVYHRTDDNAIYVRIVRPHGRSRFLSRRFPSPNIPALPVYDWSVVRIDPPLLFSTGEDDGAFADLVHYGVGWLRSLAWTLLAPAPAQALTHFLELVQLQPFFAFISRHLVHLRAEDLPVLARNVAREERLDFGRLHVLRRQKQQAADRPCGRSHPHLERRKKNERKIKENGGENGEK
eukprot:1192466-Prorocentrum_minimum.AAC.1